MFGTASAAKGIVQDRVHSDGLSSGVLACLGQEETMLTSLHHITIRSAALGACLSALLAGLPSAALGETAAMPGLAIARFDFRDTSGEVRDQTVEHSARLEDLAATLSNELSETEKIRPIALACQSDGCSARTSGLETLAKDARSSGAEYLLIGEVHKMSTLVGWMKFAVLDLAARKPVCDRFLTYRGDTDEAWHRAAEFVVRDIERHCFADKTTGDGTAPN